MADYTFINLTTAVAGFSSTSQFQVQSTDPYTIDPSVGTVSLGNVTLDDFSISSNTLRGWLTGRRPSQGQVFPRGVYNK